jgi:hypothetical protein
MQDVKNKTLRFIIRGVPAKAPTPGETYEAYILVTDTDNAASTTDVIAIKWNITNGPSATV